MKPTALPARESMNLWLSVAGQGVSSLGHYLFSFSMGLYVLSLTGSAQSYAATVAFSLLPSALLSPIVGTLADRISKKFLIVASDVLSSLLLLSFFLFVRTQALTVGSIYFVTLLMSLLSPFVSVPFTAAAPRLVSDAALPRLVSCRTAVMSIIQVAAPIASGAVYAVLDTRTFLLLASAFYAMSALSELFIDFNFSPMKQADEAPSSFLRNLAFGARYLLSSRLLLYIMGFCMMLNLLLSAVDALLPFSILEILHLKESTYGLIMAGFSAGNLLGSVYVGRLSVNFSRRLLTVCVSACALTLFAMAFPIGFSLSSQVAALLLLLACTAVGVQSAILNITSNVFLQRLVPGPLLGRINGFLMMVSMLFTPVGMLLFGTLADHFSPALIFSVCGVFVGVVALLCHRMTILDNALPSSPPETQKGRAA